jgi:acetyl-CoA acetyltransferase
MADQALKRAGIEQVQVEDRIWGWDGPWDSLRGLMVGQGDLSEKLLGTHLWRGRDAGLQAVLTASLEIQAGDYDLLLAGGGGAVSDPLRESTWETYEAAALILASPVLVGKQNLLPSGILTTKIISSSTMNMNEKLAAATQQVLQKAGIEPEQVDQVCALSPDLEMPPGLLNQLEEANFPSCCSLFRLVEVFSRLEEDQKQRALLLGKLEPQAALAILLERL